jgi:hypothetical protein
MISAHRRMEAFQLALVKNEIRTKNMAAIPKLMQ